MRPSSTQKERKFKLAHVFIVGGALALAIAAGLLLRKPQIASATPSFLGVAEGQYPSIVGSRIDTCTLCHLSTGSPSAGNLNSYGTAFLNNGLNAAALVAIENMDSDGDGFTNIQEIRALTFPGDPNDHPVAATATSMPTTAPSNTPTATAVPSNTPTVLPTTGPTATVLPTTGPTATGVPTATASLTPLPTGTIGPSQTPTETLTPAVSGTAAPTTVAACQKDDEKKEHPKKSHGKSDEKMSADDESSEAKVCEENENEIEEAHESEQAELHEQEKQGDEQNSSQQENSNQQENDGQQGNEDLQGNLGIEQLFNTSIDLWLSQWMVINTNFHE